MARPQKQGLTYFPIDVEFDDNLDLFEAEFGIAGTGFFVKLLQKIYSNSYFTEWNNDIALRFARKINVDINQVNVYINALLCRRILDKCIHEKYGVLTSMGIQKRFFEACDRRVSVEVDERILLVEIPPNMQSKVVNVYSNSINVYINDENVDINESPLEPPCKLNKIKLNNNTPPAHARENPPPDLSAVHSDSGIVSDISDVSKNKQSATQLTAEITAEIIDKQINDPEVKATFYEYIKMRKQKGKRYTINTKYCLQLCLHKLRQFANTKEQAVGVLNHSIAGNYDGLFDIYKNTTEGNTK